METTPFTGWGGVDGMCQVRNSTLLIQIPRPSAVQGHLCLHKFDASCAPGDFGTAFMISKKKKKREKRGKEGRRGLLAKK